MSYGFVYIMKNESFPNLYKIGHTQKNPHQRAIELSNTSSPYDFEVLAYASTECPHDYELAFHSTFKEKRVNDKREYFNLSEDDLKTFIRNCKIFSNEVVITQEFKSLVSDFIEKNKSS